MQEKQNQPVKKVWEDPELLLLSTEKTEFLAPDIVDGGGPYS